MKLSRIVLVPLLAAICLIAISCRREDTFSFKMGEKVILVPVKKGYKAISHIPTAFKEFYAVLPRIYTVHGLLMNDADYAAVERNEIGEQGIFSDIMTTVYGERGPVSQADWEGFKKSIAHELAQAKMIENQMLRKLNEAGNKVVKGIDSGASYSLDAVMPLGIVDDHDTWFSSLIAMHKSVRKDDASTTVVSLTMTSYLNLHGYVFQINSHCLDRHGSSKEELLSYQRALVESVFRANSRPAP